MARIAVYSEMPHGKSLVQNYLGDAERNYGLKNEVVYYDSVEAITWDIEITGAFDLVVVYRNWIVAEILRKRYRETNIMMISLGMNRVLYDIQPCFLVCEPVRAEDFMRVLMAAVGGIEKSRCFVFQSGRIRYRLNIHEIMYFESDRRLIKIRGLYGDYSFYGSMKELSEQLKERYTGYVRVHSSFIVNTEYIRGCSPRKIVMLDGTSIEINDKWRAETAKLCETGNMASIRHISTILC